MMKIGIDIGGTLIKLTIQTSINDTKTRAKLSKFISIKAVNVSEDHTILLCLIERQKFNDLEEFLSIIGKEIEQKVIYVSGGGALFFQDSLHKISPKVKEYGEFDSIIDGINFLTENLKENFYFTENYKKIPVKIGNDPLVIANIGSGTSITIVRNLKLEFITGTSLGGSTLLGFSRKLFNMEQYQDIMNYVLSGFQMPEETLNRLLIETATGLGTLPTDDQALKSCLLYDLCRSIIKSIMTICYLLSLKHEVGHILITGSFMERKDVIRMMIERCYATVFVEPNRQIKIIFCEYDGFLGAFGSLRKSFEA